MMLSRFAILLLAVSSVNSVASARAAENIGTTQEPLSTAPAPAPKPKDTCIQGYVWRETRPSDHVCVRPKVRDEVAQQNRTRAKRWTSGAYGPQTCIQGYVWREAYSGDKVCVTPEFREDTKKDNQAARSRVAR
jgi:hypothetical protein